MLVCVPPATRRDSGGTGTRCAARSTLPPSPSGAGGSIPRAAHVCPTRDAWHALCRPRNTTAPPSRPPAEGARAPCGTCACRRRCGGRSATRCPARATRLPSFQPALAEDERRAAHVCAVGAAPRTRRVGHALCRPRDTTALPGAGPPSPAGAGGGCAPCSPQLCRRRRIAIAAGRDGEVDEAVLVPVNGHRRRMHKRVKQGTDVMKIEKRSGPPKMAGTESDSDVELSDESNVQDHVSAGSAVGSGNKRAAPEKSLRA